MKFRSILKHKINCLFLIFAMISIFSCKSQITHDSLMCNDYFDAQGELFFTNCFKNDSLISSFYFDLKHNKIEIYTNPDNEAVVFNGNDSLYKEFVRKNFPRPEFCEGEGFVYVILLIDEKGDIAEKRIKRSIMGCVGIDDAVLMFIGKLPKWESAKKNGLNIKFVKIISIEIRN